MKKFDSINVIPFIDVLLVLLAIVLTTASFVSNGQLDINLPSSNAQSASYVEDPIEIAIDQKQRFYFDGSEMPLSQLAKSLEKSDSNRAILLLIDEDTPFSAFVAIMDLLKERSDEQVSIRTRKST